jgi:hypothetical protein
VGTAITSTFSLGGNQVVDSIERLLFDLALTRIGSVKIDLVCNSCAYSQQTAVLAPAIEVDNLMLITD